jgi:A/G-specific adenine glycosylase
VEKQLWQLAESHLPTARLADYTQAIMDLGATLCTRAQPRCEVCPLRADCVARREEITDQLPSSKPGKRIPTRQTVMMILRDNDGRVLLERRGPVGVWSGLWSLPEAADRDGAWRIAARLAQLDDVQALAPFTHLFSHYKLEVEPLLYADAAPVAGVADRPDLRLCDRHQLDAMGLPAPVRVLLNQL